MSFFDHRGGEPPDYPPPPRVYAWVDASSEQTGDGYTRLDCLDADWADEREQMEGLLTNPEFADQAEPQVSMILWREETEEEREGQIVELLLRDSEPGEEEPSVLHFLSLTGAPIAREAVEVRWPDQTEARRIAGVTDIGEEDAEEDEIRAALQRVGENVDAVAVYDVGQGACSALIVDEYPHLYFDMGGGALGDAATFPRNLSAICTTDMPPVVLSHWHYDHWSLAKRFGGDILRSTWIVPRQSSLGPSAATLLGLIRQHGTALVRASGAPTLREGAVSLHDCTGKTLNDSGIAMVVWGPDERVISLPGDARYKYITDLPDELTSLVAAHHGGNTRAVAAEMPNPDGDLAGRLVYSCGPSNSYGHPLQRPVATHVEAGWHPCRQLSTGDRKLLSDPEHVHLYWDVNQPTVGVGCEAKACSLAPCRR
jgi:hypothetical protein